MDDLILKNQYLTKQVERQTQEVQIHIDRITALHKVASAVSKSLDLDVTLKTALEVVTSVIGAQAGGISLIDEKTNEVVLRAQLGWEQDFTDDRPMRIPAGKGMSGKVIETDAVLVVDDLDVIQHDIAVSRFRDEPFRSIVMAPMHARNRVIGILSIMSEQPGSFDDAVIDLLKAVADTVGVALDNASLYQASVENENRLSAILESTADGIITTDQSGAIRMVNPSAERMLGLIAAEVIDSALRDVPMPTDLREPLRLALSSRDDTADKSFSVKMPDGRVLLIFVSPVFEGKNTLDPSQRDGWVIVLQDVTHLRQAEEMRSQFIQAAAHDMRNPLGVTMTSLGTLQSFVEDDLALEVIDVALSGVQRMQRLLDDLLHLERIENGYQFKIEAHDLTEIIHEVCAHMRPLCEQKSQISHLELQGELGLIPLDSHWFSRSLTNYVGNAAKYTQEGGEITVGAFKKDDFVYIEVRDNGPGIPVDVQSRLFERFYRGTDTSHERGSGLGLAIVKSVVEAHNGRVYVRSKVGEGSTFGMALPLAQVVDGILS